MYRVNRKGGVFSEARNNEPYRPLNMRGTENPLPTALETPPIMGAMVYLLQGFPWTQVEGSFLLKGIQEHQLVVLEHKPMVLTTLL